MKLSEVAEKLENGSKSTFKGNNLTIYKDELTGSILIDSIAKTDTFFLPFDCWTEIEHKRKWSKKELMLIKLLPDWACWISKDKDGSVWIWDNEPMQKKVCFFNKDEDYTSAMVCERTNSVFEFITLKFGDGAQYIGDLKGE